MIERDIRAKEIDELYDRWVNARKDWDSQAREDIDFYLGNHWSEDEAAILAERNQSSVAMDRLFSAVEQLKAILTSKPPKFSAVGREDSDSDLANVWKIILEYVWDLSDGNETFKQVVHDYCVTGLGYFYAYVDPEADYGRGEVKFTYVDPFRVAVDPNTRHRYFDDATGMILSTILSKSQLIDLYPNLNQPDEEGNVLIDNIEGTQDDEYPSTENKPLKQMFTPSEVEDLDRAEGSEKYRLLEHFSKIKIPFYRMVNKENGQEKILSYEEKEKLAQNQEFQVALGKGLIDLVEVMQTRIKLTCTLGQIVLYEKILNTDTYPIVPVPNIWTNTPYPMSDVRKNKDSQRFLNKTMSLITAHAQSSAGLKLLVPTGSVADIAELEKDWANPNATIEYDPSYGEPHFPSPQPLSSSMYGLIQNIEHYIDLNMGIFELQQGDASAAPRTASATMQIEDFGARRSKSKLRDVEGSLKRLGRVIYQLAKSHYTYEKKFRIVQPNNDITEETINMKLFDDKSMTLQSIENDISIGYFDINVVGNSTLPSNRYGEWAVYMEAFQAGLIDKTEALKKTDIFDKQGVLQRAGEIAQLQQALQGAQEQIKKLSGDLQTAQRETVAAKQRTEVEKFKTGIKGVELEHAAKTRNETDKLKNAVKFQEKKLDLDAKYTLKNAPSRKDSQNKE